MSEWTPEEAVGRATVPRMCRSFVSIHRTLGRDEGLPCSVVWSEAKCKPQQRLPLWSGSWRTGKHSRGWETVRGGGGDPREQVLTEGHSVRQTEFLLATEHLGPRFPSIQLQSRKIAPLWPQGH